MATEIRVNQLRRSRKVVGAGVAARTIVLSAEDIWKYKRENQRRDIEGLMAGTVSSDDVNWFAGGIARKAKLVGSLF
jgi:hypothetical protein